MPQVPNLNPLIPARKSYMLRVRQMSPLTDTLNLINKNKTNLKTKSTKKKTNFKSNNNKNKRKKKQQTNRELLSEIDI